MNTTLKIISLALHLILLLIIATLIWGCGETEKVYLAGTPGSDGISCTLEGNFIVCGSDRFDLSKIAGKDGKDGLDGSDGINGKDGSDGVDGTDGSDGKDGADGKDAAILTKKTIKSGCHKVYPGYWAQNLDSGYVFDLYGDSSCNDYNKKEKCDNVATSFGALNNPPVGNNKPGGGDLCWDVNIMFGGDRQSNGDIVVYIIDFN
jgi:hypothetical protein